MRHKLFYYGVVMVWMLTLAIPQKASAYNLSSVAPSGQTLYYSRSWNSSLQQYVFSVTYPASSWQGYEKPTGSLIIPDSVLYNGVNCPVIQIGAAAFRDCIGLERVVIPSTVNEINHSAFSGCTGLTSVVIPNSVKIIGTTSASSRFGDVFYNCTSLTSIVLPPDLKYICPRMFENCTALTSVVIPTGLIGIDRDAFKNCTSLTSIDIPESVTTIYAPFSGCSSLATVNFNAIDAGGNGAFSGCTNLTNVNIGSRVSAIPNGAFLDCTGLTNMVLPSSVSSIGLEAFKGCSSLTSITIPEGVTTIGQSTFENCSSLSMVSLPESLTQIEQSAFRMCTSLVSLTVGDEVTSIATNAFGGCSSLILTISNSVYSIGNYAFLNVPTVRYCGTASGSPWGAINVVPCYTEDSLIYLDNTKTVLTGSDANIHVANIPSSVVRIDASAFKNRRQLKSVTIPSSVTKIGRSAFESCTSLTSVTLPNNITKVKYRTFYSSNIQTINLPSHLEEIGDDAFRGCEISSVSLPSSLKKIGNDAFSQCTRLNTIIIPESVKQIGRYVLSGSSVKTVYFNAKEADFSHSDNYGYSLYYMFSGCDSIQNIILGDSVKRIPAYMFGGLNRVSSLVHCVLPPKVRYIGDGAFIGCSQMIDITIPESVDTLGQKIFEQCLALKKVTFNARHAESTGEPTATILAYRRYICGTLSYCGTAGAGRTFVLADLLPAYDTIIIGPNVENIPNYAFGLVYGNNHDGSRPYILDSLSYIANTKVINNSSKLRHIGAGAFGNMRIHEFDFGDSLKTIDMCAFIGNPIRKVFLPDGVLIVADGAFNNCHSLDSVSLPSTIQSLGTDCFAQATSLHYLYYDCIDARPVSFTGQASLTNSPFCSTPNLHTVNFGPHVQYLNSGLFSNADGLRRLIVPEGVEYIEDNLFLMRQNGSGLPATGGYYPAMVEESNLKYVEFPSTLVSIGPSAFSQIPVDTVVCHGTSPAWIGNVFGERTKNYGLLMIPCGSSSDYITEAEWMDFSNVTEFMPHEVSLSVNNDTMGSVSSECANTTSGGLSGVRITAVPAFQHRFVQWSDGNTTNPRVIYIDNDTAFEAQFAWGYLYNVVARSSNSGRGSVTGSGTFLQNTTDTLIATANYGYHFDHWNDGDTTNPRLLTVTASATYTATFLPNQYGLNVNSADTNMGTATGAGIYDYNTNHTIRAYPSIGYHFTAWSDGSTVNPRSVKVLGDTIFTAYFDINTYTLNVASASTTMGIATSDTNRYSHGSTAVLVATPNYGYHFTQWSDGNTDNPRNYIVTQNKTMTAQFAVNQYVVNVDADTVRGTVVGDGSYDYLSTAVLWAHPAYGYYFESWSDDSVLNPRYVSVTCDTSFTALFAKMTYNILAYTSDFTEGVAEISNNLPEYLDTITLTAIPNYGYHFTQWNDGNTDNPRRVVAVQDSSFTAIFSVNQYAVSLQASHGDVYGDGMYNYLDSCILTASANYGYHFSAWSDGNADNPRTLQVTQDTTLEALFLRNNYTLTLASNDPVHGNTQGGGTYLYLDTVQISVSGIAPHYHFSSWSDGSTDSVRNIVIVSDSSITANFAIDQHELTVLSADDEYGSVSGSGLFDYGTSATIQATPAAGYYFVGWSNGEFANPATVSVLCDTVVTATFAPELEANLYMVSVENGRNTLLWRAEPTAVSYNILRESSVAGVYETVATLQAEETMSWVDTASRPESRSYRYRLEAVDQWNSVFTGPIHKTMHLTINRGVGSNWNLVWTEYEGTQFNTYIIYRGTSPSDMAEIDRLPVGGNTTYTDANAPSSDLYYQVGIVPAQPMLSLGKSSDVILSNIAESAAVGITFAQASGIVVSSSHEGICIVGTPGMDVEVYSVDGRLVDKRVSYDERSTIVVPGGVYLVRVNSQPPQKVVVLR